MKAVLCFLVIVAGVIFADPDSNFGACCKDKGVSETCQAFCNYVSKSEDVVQAFTNGKCNPKTDGPSFYQCLENQKDNSECCKAAGVGADASLNFCLDICDGSKLNILAVNRMNKQSLSAEKILILKKINFEKIRLLKINFLLML